MQFGERHETTSDCTEGCEGHKTVKAQCMASRQLGAIGKMVRYDGNSFEVSL